MSYVTRFFKYLWRASYGSWLFTWTNRKRLFRLAGVVAVPSALLRSYQNFTIDFSLVLFVASLYCVLSIIYFCQNFEAAEKLSVAGVYTRASGRFLQLLGVSLVQALVVVPLLGGVALSLFVASLEMNQLLYIPAAALSLASLWLLVRLSLAPYIAACEGSSVWRAVRESAQRSRGQHWRIIARYGSLLTFIVIAAMVIFFVINLSSVLAQSWLVQGLASAILITIILPWLVVFGYSIYDELTQ